MKYTYPTEELMNKAFDKAVCGSFGTYLDGIYLKACYANGYGFEIVKHKATYGSDPDLWELYVLKKVEDPDDEDIETRYTANYETDITEDVVPSLTNEQVMLVIPLIRWLDDRGQLPEGTNLPHFLK